MDKVHRKSLILAIIQRPNPTTIKQLRRSSHVGRTARVARSTLEIGQAHLVSLKIMTRLAPQPCGTRPISK